MDRNEKDQNLDKYVIDNFGHEWATFDYADAKADQALDAQFLAYSAPIDLKDFYSSASVAADFGAGSGRWVARLLPYFLLIYALEPSDGGIKVLNQKFANEPRVRILQETVGSNSIPDNTLDLAMSLGVLHHIPDTGLAIKDVATKLKKGGVFLCYLYYKLDHKPLFYRGLFWLSNSIRFIISRLPRFVQRFFARTIAGAIYLPLARTAKLLKKGGYDVSNFPLHHYSDMPFVMLHNDALDRFGTRLEQRFSKDQISNLLVQAGFDISTLRFSNIEPFWTFTIKKNRH